MLTDWMHWLSSLCWDEVIGLMIGFTLLDGPRYVVATMLVVIRDWLVDSCRWLLGASAADPYTHCPSVCVIIVGLNEGCRLRATLESLIGTYPRLELVVCDDGSTDDMSQVARQFHIEHPWFPMRVITRPWRGGKSSALNLAFSVTKADIVVGVDGDSNLEPETLWEIVQPFKDPSVGVVSGMVCVRNWYTNLCTWCQALEYLQSILIGRRVAHLLKILPLSSGALSAFRRDVLVRLRGWDVGPGEDLDIALRVRKLGYQIAFAPGAICQTEAPTTWKALFKQRFRWCADASVRHFIRKHNDLANVTWANFRLSNMMVFLDSLVFQLICGMAALLWLAIQLLPNHEVHWLNVTLTFYAVALMAELYTSIAILYYSRHPGTDAILILGAPLMPIYRLVLMAVRIHANNCEILYRASYYVKHVPQHVSDATWRW